jgi:transcriptional regulator with XRE-family HTH domain
MRKSLRDIRKERHMSRAYVCDRLGITTNALSRKESGSRKFTLIEYGKLLDLYEVDSSEVLEVVQ